ncbi:MAG: hypothetical protein OXE84_07320 [Rhodobacteraceae bacterium]|nr:hypothetical protein [Paracoccaceae bacterium]MCY4196782.1 hypothetical protein [Paracoccaceae bacterium]
MSETQAQQLRVAMKSAVTRGIGFLDTAVVESGAWPCESYGSCPDADDRPPFLAAAGALALEASGDQRVRNVLASTREFLMSRIEPPGLWRWAPFNLDVDSTCLCALALGPQFHPELFMGRNVEHILSNRDTEGRFLTWMSASGPFGSPNDADPVVNANVVTYLGDRADTRPAQRWVERVVSDGRGGAGLSLWYGPPMDLYYCVSRAANVAAPVFKELKPILTERILGDQTDNALSIAQALCSLDMLGAKVHSDFVHQRAKRLISMQQSCGSWPACVVCQTPAGVCVFYSQTLTTAYCIEALSRLIRN